MIKDRPINMLAYVADPKISRKVSKSLFRYHQNANSTITRGTPWNCVDSIDGWVDSRGRDCTHYESNDFCNRDSTYGQAAHDIYFRYYLCTSKYQPKY